MIGAHIEELDEQRPGIAVHMGAPVGSVPVVVDTTHLGGAIDPFTGKVYRVVASRHDRDWPGTDSPLTFAVEEVDQRGRVKAAWGFMVEHDCWKWLTGSGVIELTYPGLHGEPIYEMRRCLGIPDHYVRKES